MLTPAKHHTAQWCHIHKIPAPGHDDKFDVRDLAIGRVKPDPSRTWQPRLDPRVGSVTADQFFHTWRWLIQNIAAHISSRQFQRPQTTQHEVSKILANATLLGKHFGNG